MTMGNLNSVTCTRERLLTPIAVGTARKEELQFAEVFHVWEVQPQADAMRHVRRAPHGNSEFGSSLVL